MSKRLSVALISVAFLSGLVLGAIWHKLRIFPFPQLSYLVHGQANGFRQEFTNNWDYYIPDNTAGHLHKPHTVRTLNWKEHPKGVLKMAVNNLGFREDVDTAVKKHGQTYRILVTGDSHIDGLVYNSESFTNRLEGLLNSSYPRSSFELLNGGTGNYGPYNYTGFLNKFLDLNPDMFIVVVYTGNDFLDGIRTAEIRHHLTTPKRSEGYVSRLRDVSSQHSGAVWQGINQAYFFKNYSAFMTKAVDIAYQQLLDIAHICSSRDIELLVLTLPTKCNMPGSLSEGACESASEELDLTSADVEVNQTLGRQLLSRLESNDVQTLDPFNEMQRSRDPLYWIADHHLNHG